MIGKIESSDYKLTQLNMLDLSFEQYKSDPDTPYISTCDSGCRFDGKIMPTPDQKLALIKMAQEIQELKEQRSRMPQAHEISQLHKIVLQFLMHRVYGDDFVDMRPSNPNFREMNDFFKEVQDAFDMHSIGMWNNVDEFENSLMAIAIDFYQIAEKRKIERAEQLAANTTTWWSTGVSIGSSIIGLLPFAATVPVPIIVGASLLVRTQGVFGAAGVLHNMLRLGISAGSLGVNTLACIVNITARLL